MRLCHDGRPSAPSAKLGGHGSDVREGRWAGEQHRVYLTMDGAVRRGPVHVVHDLPHLVVESVFGIEDGLWAELEASRHAAAARAVTARDPKRQKTRLD